MSDDVKVDSSMSNIMKMNLYFFLVSCDSFWNGDLECVNSVVKELNNRHIFGNTAGWWLCNSLMNVVTAMDALSPELSPELSSPEVWHNDIVLFVMFSFGSSGNVVKVFCLFWKNSKTSMFLQHNNLMMSLSYQYNKVKSSVFHSFELKLKR